MPAPDARDRPDVVLSRPDALALLHVVVVLEGWLMSEATDTSIVDDLANRLTDMGLCPVSPKAPDDLTSIRVAIADLNQRLRQSLGGADEDVLPTEATCHVLEVESVEVATNLAQSLWSLGPRTVCVGLDRGRHRLYAEFPELMPGEAFAHRKAQLIALATEFGGRYVGSQDV